MARDDFNTQFAAALENKMKTREARGRAFDASAGFDTARAGVVGANSRSAIDLQGAQAGLTREKTGLLGREVESMANLRDQNARGRRIDTNLNVGTTLNEIDPRRFAGGIFNYGGGTGGTSAFTDDSGGAYGALNSPSNSTISGSTQAPVYQGDNNYGSSSGMGGGNLGQGVGIWGERGASPYDKAEGGLVRLANGGVVGAPDSALVNEYQLYREAAIGAGIPALPMKEAIPRMAQLRRQKQEATEGIIAKGGTTPQGYADGGEIDGPGTGKSDSIPAMIDGVQAAAVSDGEFLIPRHVVDYFGTKMFDGLVEKARMAGNATKRKTEYGCGGAVKRHGR